ncbi:MAG TPA: hypothetical protein VFH62_08485, partial [Dehalococcoidia bacterium]|nr:hypothetical protein [Dehalococcoidia bacterium]
TVVEALGTADERTTTYTRDATSHRVSSMTDPLGRETDVGSHVNPLTISHASSRRARVIL